jgi:hypothetical protein
MDELIHKAEELYNQGNSPAFITEHLTEICGNKEDAEAAWRHFSGKLVIERRKRGVILLVIGSVCLLLGFILTAFLFHTDASFQWVMYSVTCVGIGLIFLGIIDVLGF